MPLTADQAVVVVRDLFVPAYVNEHPLTKGVIASIPEQQSGYKPDEVSRSAIDLAWHIVAAECRFLNAVAAGAFDFSGGTRPETIKKPTDVVQWYSSAFGAAIERVRALGGDDLLKPIDFRGIFNFPAYAYLQSGISHSIHHRGQLSTYLRPMGGRVPSIYGESYDSRQTRENAGKT
jgi:uncharacterized damage-inducible protein DinB